ncbi:capsular polysaccharide biosynthesis protein [Fibrobacter succinogenes subsp. succinogenes S85]|uniref:Capsular polysaccharide biosynthesis protein n=1 Tax=Fibrobacter succinogenes (strain ATCC 19169 / S85) TaxID=59374 RepID=D9S5K0_FIBSS|nr:glycosyltransferase [Fibrobacter succinogenes]ADL24826.1 capsular polysaccharide biosynthesis protein [Fibrobacter succinogenes subsp. succinogenes S85]
MSIPKIIHYCWLSGDPYPELVQFCMQSWKEKLPDYDFVLWDKSHFDIHSVPWVEQACFAKKWAFAADYIRLYTLYNYGGIYLDSDVEVLKPFDTLLDRKYFFGREHTPDSIENQESIEAATFGSEKGLSFIKSVMAFYEKRDFCDKNGFLNTTTLPTVMARCLRGNPLEVFPMDYFSPKNTRTLALETSKNTYSIHHFNGSWHSLAQQKHVALRTKLCKVFGERVGEILASFCAVFINFRYEGVFVTMKKILAKL